MPPRRTRMHNTNSYSAMKNIKCPLVAIIKGKDVSFTPIEKAFSVICLSHDVLQSKIIILSYVRLETNQFIIIIKGNPSSMGWRMAQHPTRDHSVPSRGVVHVVYKIIYEDRKDRWGERACSARDDTAGPHPSPTTKSPKSWTKEAGW